MSALGVAGRWCLGVIFSFVLISPASAALITFTVEFTVDTAPDGVVRVFGEQIALGDSWSAQFSIDESEIGTSFTLPAGGLSFLAPISSVSQDAEVMSFEFTGNTITGIVSGEIHATPNDPSHFVQWNGDTWTTIGTKGGQTGGGGIVIAPNSFALPEPGTALLLGLGFAGLGITRRRRASSYAG